VYYIVKADFFMDKNDEGFKLWELALLIALSLALIAGVWAEAHIEKLSSSLIRLHVLAASDAEAEQEIKLSVRDAVLEYMTPRFGGEDTAEAARRKLEAELDGIKLAAETAAQGRRVSVSLSEEYYPTREYGDLTLPAGRYQSLRVILGEGEGHNWWCVIFPPLCLDAAACERAVEALDADTGGIITAAEGYELRLRIVELWGELCARLG